MAKSEDNLEMKKELVVVRGDQPINYSVFSEIDLEWFDRIDELFEKFKDKRISQYTNVFDLSVTDPDPEHDFIHKPFSKIRRSHARGGGAFFSEFLVRLFGSKTNWVLDLQKKYSSLSRRGFSEGCRIQLIPYQCQIDNNVQITDRTDEIHKVDYAISYHTTSYFKCSWFGEMDDIIDKYHPDMFFFFYLDPFSASRSKNKVDFSFLYSDGKKNHYHLFGVDYKDTFIRKRQITEYYNGQGYCAQFLTISQLSRYMTARGKKMELVNYVKSTRNSYNIFMLDHVKVIVVEKEASVSVLPATNNDKELQFSKVNVEILSGGTMRPFMMTLDRMNVIQSELTWYAHKVDGYQAYCIAKSSFLYMKFRNNMVYRTKIKYNGPEVRFQATVILQSEFVSSDKLVSLSIIYEDYILGPDAVSPSFRTRYLRFINYVKAGIPITMKQWQLYDSDSVVFDPIKYKEGIIFQLDLVGRRFNGSYVCKGRPCFFLKDEYTLDVTVKDGKFRIGEDEIPIDQGSALVREIVYQGDGKFKFMRDRFDRTPNYMLNDKSFLDDYVSALSIPKFNVALPGVRNLPLICAPLIMVLETGAEVDQLLAYKEAIIALRHTGTSKLIYKERPVPEGIYVWRDHFQRLDEIDWFLPVDIEF
jgi:hypothetical protein